MRTEKKSFVEQHDFLLLLLVLVLMILATLAYGYRDSNESWRIFTTETKPEMEHALKLSQAEEVLQTMNRIQVDTYQADSLEDLEKVVMSSVFMNRDLVIWELAHSYHARTAEVVRRASSNNSAVDAELAYKMTRGLVDFTLNIAAARVKEIDNKIEEEAPSAFWAAICAWLILGVFFGLVAVCLVIVVLEASASLLSRSSCAE